MMKAEEPSQQVDPCEGFISGWARIAKHLDVSIRTAQRWHAKLGMPVFQVEGKVLAHPSLLNIWIKAFSEACKRRGINHVTRRRDTLNGIDFHRAS